MAINSAKIKNWSEYVGGKGTKTCISLIKEHDREDRDRERRKQN